VGGEGENGEREKRRETLPFLTLHSSHLTPHFSSFIPHTSLLTLHFSLIHTFLFFSSLTKRFKGDIFLRNFLIFTNLIV
jgi:hypothetical protein